MKVKIDGLTLADNQPAESAGAGLYVIFVLGKLLFETDW
jgi:hypothetical protein